MILAILYSVYQEKMCCSKCGGHLLFLWSLCCGEDCLLHPTLDDETDEFYSEAIACSTDPN